MTFSEAQTVLGMGDVSESFYQYAPRPDNHELFDQQTSFLNDRLMGTAWLLGGNGSGTTETAMRKLARFVMDTPPPRPRTPYWIIGESYAQICAMWDEKLSPSGHGHIPEAEIDWDNIAWFKPNRNWPFAVPLNKWPNGNSWTLVFKSYEQGRQKMQAESIGGFCFVEQFPWGIYEEVMRGSREYSFPGAKIAEFTPVDPEKSYALEVMIEEDTLPPGDKVYYLNTDCALAAGHVTQTWYDSFYGIVSDDMQDVRKRGLFSTFEGLIYKGFNQFVHLVGDDECFPGGEFPINVQYRRALDWGSGIENAQVCLWGYYNSFGEWYIYDEYWSTDQETTVNQHLKLIYDRWGWPYNNPAFGMAYADPSSKDCIRIASKFSTVYPECDDFSMVGANNAVIEGIDHVKFLLQTQASTGKPRLFIHKANCPNLVREMRTYRWLVGAVAGRNPRQARMEPLKKDDHVVDALRYLTFSEANTTGSVAQSFRRSSPAIKKSVRLDVQGSRGRMRR
jgi:phage terminase large subunit-like protein